MDSVFQYSRWVNGKNFVGRRSDASLLGNLLSQGEHVAIYEPPKAGKTSLVQQTLMNMKMSGKSFKVGEMSVLNIRTAQEFILAFGSAVIRMAASTPDEYRRIVEEKLSGTHFVFDSAAFAEDNRILSLSWDADRKDVSAVLRLPFMLSQGPKMFVILDEFQCVNLLENPDDVLVPLGMVLKEMRAEGNRSCSMVFCGSGVNGMKSIFHDSLTFRKSVEHVPLSPIDKRDMADFISRGFQSSGKVINKMEILMDACELFKSAPWYAIHFAAICDSMTRGYIMEPVLVEALEALVTIHQPRFRDIMQNLTTHQVNLLKAAALGVTRFSAADVIRTYGLNSSANVKRVKDALMKKEVLTFDSNDVPRFLDPLFEYWLKKVYFGLI